MKQYAQKAIGLRHELHKRAELSGKEIETRKFLLQYLREHTSLKPTECDGWFYVRIPAEEETVLKALNETETCRKPPIAFRADMDALPIADIPELPYASEQEGVSHRCGHDGHMAALMGLGLYLDSNRPDRDVYLIFQPAEEIGAGGERCAALIKEKGIGEVYAFHNLPGYPEGTVTYRHGLTQPASEGLMIRIKGKCSHASEPEKGNNPAETLAHLLLYAKALPGRYEMCEGMKLCTIVGGGVGAPDFGVSAGDAWLGCTLRAEQEEVLHSMETDLKREAERLCAQAGLTCTFEVTDFFPETRNHEESLARVTAAAGQLGYETCEMNKLWRASEDFGYYTKECPGAIFYIGAGEKAAPLHTREYDFDDRLIEKAMRMFKALI